MLTGFELDGSALVIVQPVGILNGVMLWVERDLGGIQRFEQAVLEGCDRVVVIPKVGEKAFVPIEGQRLVILEAVGHVLFDEQAEGLIFAFGGGTVEREIREPAAAFVGCDGDQGRFGWDAEGERGGQGEVCCGLKVGDDQHAGLVIFGPELHGDGRKRRIALRGRGDRE